MPRDTKPHVARQAKKRHARLRRAGTLEDCRREVWRAILCAKEVMLAPGTDADTTLKAVHAITQASSAYARLVEASELEARVDALEALARTQPLRRAI